MLNFHKFSGRKGDNLSSLLCMCNVSCTWHLSCFVSITVLSAKLHACAITEDIGTTSIPCRTLTSPKTASAAAKTVVVSSENQKQNLTGSERCSSLQLYGFSIWMKIGEFDRLKETSDLKGFDTKAVVLLQLAFKLYYSRAGIWYSAAKFWIRVCVLGQC